MTADLDEGPIIEQDVVPHRRPDDGKGTTTVVIPTPLDGKRAATAV